ncbi:MAG: polyphenol oxidase family protein [Bacilli bacterium]|nr:polyphenol oxidase family protein [Bacilli bacterium]
MESKIVIFEANKEDGIFSIGKKFYPKGTLKKDREQKFYQARLKLGKKLGIDGNHIFKANQKGEYKPDVDHKDGAYILLNKSHMKKKDFYRKVLPADILILSEEYKNIAVANPSADCPVLICEDRKQGYTALSHCGGKYINRYLPRDTIKALIENGSKVEDIYVYIGSCIKKESYTYDRRPLWATNTLIWKGFIEKKKKTYYIDLVGAIKSQLEKMGITHIEESKIDVAKDSHYFSNHEAAKGMKEKSGQNLIGFYYK